MSKTRLKVIHVTATTDAESIGDNKVIAQSIEFPGVFHTSRGRAMLRSIQILDETTTGPAVDILISSTNSAITGDEGKSIGEDIDDLDVSFRNMQGHVSIAASDWTDMFDAKMATKTNIDLVLHAANNTDRSIYIHVINRSGSNWTAATVNDMKIKLGIEAQL